MAKKRISVTIDDSVLKAVKIRAARQGRGQSEVIERVLRDALFVNPIEAIWNSIDPQVEIGENEAMALALEAQSEVREQQATERAER